MNFYNVPIRGGDKAKHVAVGLTGMLVNEFARWEGGSGGVEKNDTEFGRGNFRKCWGKGLRKYFGGWCLYTRKNSRIKL